MAQLYAYQQQHMEKLKEVFTRSRFALDTSMMGAGKSYVACALASTLHFRHAVVVAPVSVTGKWKQLLVQFGVPVNGKHIMSYQKLRGTNGKVALPHGLLTRGDLDVVLYSEEGNPRTVHRTTYEPTQTLKDYIRDGCLLILDEIQNAKNLNVTHKAVTALIGAFKAGADSKVLILSGSLFDKTEHAYNLYRYLNVTHQTCVKDAVPQIEHHARTGEDAVGDAADGEEEDDPRKASDHHAVIHQCFLDSIKTNYASSMVTQPLYPDVKVHGFDGEFNIEDSEDVEKIAEGIHAAQTAFRLKAVGEISSAECMSIMTAAFQRVERAKAQTFFRLVCAKLAETGTKVVVALNYLETIQQLASDLEEFKPLTITGDTTTEQRGEILEAFQRCDGEFRLLIGSLPVLSTGIDLDSKDANWPRTCFVSPNFRSIDLYQLIYRFKRADTACSSEVYMVYAKACLEQNIVSALQRKGSVMASITPEQVEAGVLFPGTLEKFVEPSVEVEPEN